MLQFIRQDDGRHQSSVHVGGRGAGGDDSRDGQPLLECCSHNVTSERRHEDITGDKGRQVADIEDIHAETHRRNGERSRFGCGSTNHEVTCQLSG